MRTWTLAEVFAVIAAVWYGAPALLGIGKWPAGDRARLGFLVLDTRRPRLLWDGYLRYADVDALRRLLGAHGTVHDGRFDFMFATPWKVACVPSAKRVAVYTRRGLRFVATPDGLDVRAWNGRMTRIPATEIAEIRGEGDSSHARTRVRAILKNGRAITLVAAYDFGVWFSDDPWAIYESWPLAIAEDVGACLAKRPDCTP